MTSLKLLALDDDDLEVISLHLQDAVMRVGDMAYLPSQNRFAAVLNRFDWVAAVESNAKTRQRRRAALRFDRVFDAKLKGFRPDQAEEVLSLLAIQFTPEDGPSGVIHLTFSGNKSIRLEAECIEVELKDLGPVWKTRSQPRHPDTEPEAEM